MKTLLAAVLWMTPLGASAAEPKHEFYDMPRIIRAMEESPVHYVIEPEDFDLARSKQAADSFWPLRKGIDMPKIVEEGERVRLIEYPGI